MPVNKVIYGIDGEEIVDQSGNVTVYSVDGTSNRVNKVVFGASVIVDITDTTATEDQVLSGYIIHKADGSKVTGTASQTILNSDGESIDDDTLIVNDGSGGGGSVTITDEANTTGITCVITTSSEPSSDIPLNTELIVFGDVVNGYHIDGTDGSEHANEAACCSDFTKIDSSMTFSFIGYEWFDMAFYDSSKTFIRGSMQYYYGDTFDGEYANGTLDSSRIPSNAEYIRLSSYPTNPTSSTLSLIRTA